MHLVHRKWPLEGQERRINDFSKADILRIEEMAFWILGSFYLFSSSTHYSSWFWVDASRLMLYIALRLLLLNSHLFNFLSELFFVLHLSSMLLELLLGLLLILLLLIMLMLMMLPLAVLSLLKRDWISKPIWFDAFVIWSLVWLISLDITGLTWSLTIITKNTFDTLSNLFSAVS